MGKGYTSVGRSCCSLTSPSPCKWMGSPVGWPLPWFGSPWGIKPTWYRRARGEHLCLYSMSESAPCLPLRTQRPWRERQACAWSRGLTVLRKEQGPRDSSSLVSLTYFSSYLLHSDHILFFRNNYCMVYEIDNSSSLTTLVYIYWEQQKIMKSDSRVIKCIKINMFCFVLRRLAVGLLFTQVTWRVLFSPAAGGWQSWMFRARLSPRCIPFCVLVSYHFPDAPILGSQGLWCFNSVLSFWVASCCLDIT